MTPETKQIKGFVCCLCGERKEGWGENKQYGNNPRPVKNEGECCDECNTTKVIPARLRGVGY